MAINIDEMLDVLSFAGAEMVNGNANHGPMAGEALFSLGREEAVLPWVDAYKGRLVYRPEPSLAIRRDDWREYLGSRERLGDWIQFFENELEDAPWQDVVRLWVPQLAPAVMAAATHGLIRTAHAVRSLSGEETTQRRDELARGLGFWAARYYALPGDPSATNAGHTPRGALDSVERLHGPEFDGSGPITEQIKGMEEHPEFAPAIDLADASGDLSLFLSNITETFAGIYLASTKKPDRLRTHGYCSQRAEDAGSIPGGGRCAAGSEVRMAGLRGSLRLVLHRAGPGQRGGGAPYGGPR